MMIDNELSEPCGVTRQLSYKYFTDERRASQCNELTSSSLRNELQIVIDLLSRVDIDIFEAIQVMFHKRLEAEKGVLHEMSTRTQFTLTANTHRTVPLIMSLMDISTVDAVESVE
jgi:hypothetical protein